MTHELKKINTGVSKKNINVWGELKYFFGTEFSRNHDVNSYVEISIHLKNESSNLEVLKFLLNKSERLPDDTTSWNPITEELIPCNRLSCEELYQRLRYWEPEHTDYIPLNNINIDDSIIPSLSYHIDQYSTIKLGYIVGKEWNAKKIDAFLFLLKEIKKISSFNIYMIDDEKDFYPSVHPFDEVEMNIFDNKINCFVNDIDYCESVVSSF